MSSSSLLPSSLASVRGRAQAGHWKLPAGRALSLYPRERCVLEITLGRVWVTAPDVHGASVDQVLVAGERLVVGPGSHVVIEPWGCTGWPAAAFRWDGVPSAVRADWEHAVAQPARELAQALSRAGRAGARVLAGLWDWAGLPAHAGGRGGVPCGGG